LPDYYSKILDGNTYMVVNEATGSDNGVSDNTVVNDDYDV
jgi:hypothetical protein